ncbi:TPA: hypothetical protein OBS83_004753 [Escherichia coli]|uniref:hypothetical protein n=1 Tax=Escherichia coli TaxID=562 RepID=UPI0013B44BA1|nr:hypothetical protein [Escherichia coli]HCO6571625.1 hypothetical protein [Escherichia coli]HCO6674176.1 hypothetical protein [Escherichia coli]HCO6811702.1 hypothetical protein [Escherichia coli]
MLPPFHLIFQHPGLIPFSQQKGLRVQKRVYFSPNQTKQTNINMIEEIFDSESGTNIHKASLQSGAFSFSGYGRFLVVATRYLFAGFLAIFADVRYF